MIGHAAARSAYAAVIAAIVLSGCSTTSPPLPPPAPAIAPTPLVEPKPPAGASTNMVLPPRDAGGRYQTINSGIGPAATIWHLRSALNVAALGCRGPQEATLTADYNRLLADKRSLLATAFARTEADARASGGKDWRDAHDRQMTRLYNYFALPPAKPAFCQVAVQVAAEAAVTPAASFQTFADTALPRLEAPFLDFFARYDSYRIQLAQWRSKAMQTATPAGGPTANVAGFSDGRTSSPIVAGEITPRP